MLPALLPALGPPPTAYPGRPVGAGRDDRRSLPALLCLPLLACLAAPGCGPSQPAPAPAPQSSAAASEKGKPAGEKPAATATELAQARAAAEKALDDGRVDDAVTLATFVAERDRTGAGHELLGRAWLVRATQAAQAGDEAAAQKARLDAAAAYRRAAEADPENPALQDATGLVVDSTGDLTAAIGHYSKAIHLAPTQPTYRLHRGNAYVRDGQMGPAQSDARALLDLAPEDPWSHALMAEVHLRTPNPKLALESAQRARDRGPSEIAFRVLCSRALRANGRPEDAVELLIGLPEAERGSIAVAGELASGWNDLGRPERAAEAWRGAYRLAPAHERFACAIAAGFACTAAKDVVGAEQWLDMAALLRPSDPKVASLREAIVAAKSATPTP